MKGSGATRRSAAPTGCSHQGRRLASRGRWTARDGAAGSSATALLPVAYSVAHSGALGLPLVASMATGSPKAQATTVVTSRRPASSPAGLAKQFIPVILVALALATSQPQRTAADSAHGMPRAWGGTAGLIVTPTVNHQDPAILLGWGGRPDAPPMTGLTASCPNRSPTRSPAPRSCRRHPPDAPVVGISGVQQLGTRRVADINGVWTEHFWGSTSNRGLRTESFCRV